MLDGLRGFKSRLHNRLARIRPVRIGWLTFIPSILWVRAQLRIGELEKRIALQSDLPQGQSTESKPETRRRSVVFVHNAYYNFFYLAEALRARGWDAISVSVEDPESPVYQFYHGEDVNLYDSDPERYAQNLSAFLKEIPDRFKMLHFYGMGRMALHPDRFDGAYPHEFFDKLPKDFLFLKQIGMKIGYTTSGCNDGVAQSTFREWSKGCCDLCVFQNDPQVCSDRRNLAWGHKVAMFVDLFATEGNAANDYQGIEAAVQVPVTSALDADVWHPELVIPEQWKIERGDAEMLIYHSVGNFRDRSDGTRNIKGTHAIIEAVDRMESEGLKVRLEFRTGVDSINVRYVQAQCDVVIDQIVFGRYGSTAREGMMLGKPVISRIDPTEPNSRPVLEHLRESPIISADVDSIYQVLKDLYFDTERRRVAGQKSREFALKWHSKEACAERFEVIYDSLIAQDARYQNH